MTTEILPIIRHAKVMGVFARPPEVKEMFKALPVNSPLTFEEEPTNPHDKYAVKILAGGTFIGYVPKEISASIGLFDSQKLIGMYHSNGEFSVGVFAE